MVMKLYVSPTSPYARKTRIAWRMKGLSSADITEISLNPFGDTIDQDLMKANPLYKIPTLVLDDGTALYDSRVILNYLDGLTDTAVLCDRTDPQKMLRTEVGHALGDGLTDQLVNILLEGRRPETEVSQRLIFRWREKCKRSVALIEEIASSPNAGESLCAASLACACALGAADFRKLLPGWREEFPKTAQWMDRLNQNEHFIATAPFDPAA